MKTVGELAPTLFADRQARSGLAAPWANGMSGKEFRATMGRKAVGGIFSIGLEETYRWKDSVQSGPEIRLWALDGIANGVRRGSRNSRARCATGAGYRWWSVSMGGTTGRSLPAQRRAAGAGRNGVLATDRALLRRRAGAHAGLLPGADRGAHPV